MSECNNKFTVLVVDDDPTIRMVVSNMLRSNGFQTLKALNGREGFEQAKQKRPDLILLDINMPEMNGIEACKQLKEDSQTADIPVIFMTSLGNDADRVEGFEAGGEDYVIKPVNYQELLARMKRFVDATSGAMLDKAAMQNAVDGCLLQIEELAVPEMPDQFQPNINRLMERLKSIKQMLQQANQAH